MVFGPWMNSQNEVDFDGDTAKVDFSEAAQHTQWNLVSAGVNKRVVAVTSKDKQYSARYPNLSYYFIIERHSSMIFKVIKGKI